ncbi:heterokaryon incompatibility protein-domain-containing protein [Xylariaceae sp. FL0662B]|nr:heterokaryon incompatibility protein-domain-containing protein [Xylariaceae sp. FL0662B]
MATVQTRYQDECSFCKASRVPNEKLCRDCQIWDIDEHVFTCKSQPDIDPSKLSSVKRRDLIFGEGEPFADRIEDLEYISLEEYATRQMCMVCRQIYHGALRKKLDVDDNLDTRIRPLRPFAVGIPSFDRDQRGLRNSPYTLECVLPIALEQRQKGPPRPKSQDTNAVYSTFALELILTYNNETGRTLLDVSPWDRSFFSLDFIQQWLADCQHTHGFDCNDAVSPVQLPTAFRVIDTYDRCVVMPPNDIHYDFVTLSYVWASASGGRDTQLKSENLDQLAHPGSLTAQEIPHLIEDAIILCSRLGQRYLWVDRLCIVQDDATSKHAQIQAMDAIYHLALFTIIALTNGSDAVGLPGSPNRPRPASDLGHEWQFGRQGKGFRVFPSMGLVEDSEWNTRGWTFQERLLSGRHLFVSAQQILMCCGKYSLSGNIPLTPEEMSLGVVDQGNRQDLERGVRQIRYYRKYRIVVGDYSRKRLSFGSDILNAFTGITQVVGSILETDFIFGLPERFFLESLLWGPVGASRRRSDTPQIPSWSWAAWDAGVDYRPIQTFDASGYHVGSLVAFYVVDRIRGLRRVNANYHWFVESFDGPPSERPPGLRFSMRQWKEAMAIACSSRPGSLEVWEQCPHNPSETLQRLEIPANIEKFAKDFPGSLVFNTTKATLLLKVPPPDGTHKTPLKNIGANQEFLLICDKLSNPIGMTMWMDKHWREQNLSLEDTHEFIVLGASVQTYQYFDTWPFGSTDCPWGLYVMLVERHGPVYQRVAIGAVVVNAWASVDPLWDTIVLG